MASSVPATSSPSPFPPRIGRYELLAPIATGGTATVFIARVRGVRGFEREVAVKLMHAHLRISPHSKDAGAELLEEAKLAARMRHPNVVPVLDVGDDPAGIYLVMDYIEGDSLASLLRATAETGAPLPTGVALRILDDALAGLQAAHELRDETGAPLSLVHRDFSPQNILLGIDGVARLTDFGIARATSRAEFTRTGVVKGKVAYMSPEQAQGAELDQRCDVWAAGVVAWEMFAGRQLYRSADPMATMLRVVSEVPPRLSTIRPDVPAALDDAVAWALTPDLDRRCPSVKLLRERILAAWQGRATPADPAEVGALVATEAGPRMAELRSMTNALVEERAQALRLSAEAADASSAPGIRLWRRRAMIAGGLGAAAAGILVWKFTVGRADDPRTPGSRPAPTPAAPSTVAPPETDPTALPAAPEATPPPAAPQPRSLRLRANVAVVEVKLGDRLFVPSSPAREVEIGLGAQEASRPLRVEALAVDGRRASMRTDGTGAPVSLEFKGPRPPKARAKTRRSDGQKLPLAPSPY